MLATWLNRVNPVVNVSLDSTGVLTYSNVAVDARAATPAEGYSLSWFRFSNESDTKTKVGETAIVSGLRAEAPPELLKSGSDYLGVTITARHRQHAGWARPATFYFRRAGGLWEAVGAER